MFSNKSKVVVVDTNRIKLKAFDIESSSSRIRSKGNKINRSINKRKKK